MGPGQGVNHNFNVNSNSNLNPPVAAPQSERWHLYLQPINDNNIDLSVMNRKTVIVIDKKQQLGDLPFTSDWYATVLFTDNQRFIMQQDDSVEAKRNPTGLVSFGGATLSRILGLRFEPTANLYDAIVRFLENEPQTTTPSSHAQLDRHLGANRNVSRQNLVAIMQLFNRPIVLVSPVAQDRNRFILNPAGELDRFTGAPIFVYCDDHSYGALLLTPEYADKGREVLANIGVKTQVPLRTTIKLKNKLHSWLVVQQQTGYINLTEQTKRKVFRITFQAITEARLIQKQWQTAYRTASTARSVWSFLNNVNPATLVQNVGNWVVMPAARQTGNQRLVQVANVALNAFGLYIFPPGYIANKITENVVGKVVEGAEDALEIENSRALEWTEIIKEEAAYQLSSQLLPYIQHGYNVVQDRFMKWEVLTNTASQTTSSNQQPQPTNPLKRKIDEPTASNKKPRTGAYPLSSTTQTTHVSRSFKSVDGKVTVTLPHLDDTIQSVGNGMIQVTSKDGQVNYFQAATGAFYSRPDANQIEAAQQTVNQNQQTYNQAQTFSQYTSVDMENISKQIWEGAQSYTTKESRANYIDEQLAKYGIPYGAYSGLIAHGFADNPGKHVPKRIKDALGDWKSNGSGLQNATNNLNNAQNNLNILSDPNYLQPSSTPQGFSVRGSQSENTNANSSTQNIPPEPVKPFDLKELVTDSENEEGKDYFRQAQYIVDKFCQKYGEQHREPLKKAFTNAWFPWAQKPGHKKDKDEYGLLVNTLDVYVNGTTTIPISEPHRSVLQKVVGGVQNVANEISKITGQPTGIAMAANGNGVTMGPTQNPNLVPIYSNQPAEPVPGIVLPPQNPSERTGSTTMQPSSGNLGTVNPTCNPTLSYGSVVNSTLTGQPSLPAQSSTSNIVTRLRSKNPVSTSNSNATSSISTGKDNNKNLGLLNAKDGLSLAGNVIHQPGYHGGPALAANVVSVFNEIGKNPNATGVYNAAVEVGIDTALDVVGVGPLATVASLYSNNIPAEQVQQQVQGTRDYANQFDSSNMFENIAQRDLRESAQEQQTADAILRGIDRGINALKEFFKSDQ